MLVGALTLEEGRAREVGLFSCANMWLFACKRVQ